MITLGPEFGTYVTSEGKVGCWTSNRVAIPSHAHGPRCAARRNNVADLATTEIPALRSVRVRIGASELRAVFPDEATARDESLEIDFDIDDQKRIVRIGVRQRGVSPVDGEEAPGWQVRCTGFGASTTATLPPRPM